MAAATPESPDQIDTALPSGVSSEASCCDTSRRRPRSGVGWGQPCCGGRCARVAQPARPQTGLPPGLVARARHRGHAEHRPRPRPRADTTHRVARCGRGPRSASAAVGGFVGNGTRGCRRARRLHRGPPALFWITRFRSESLQKGCCRVIRLPSTRAAWMRGPMHRMIRPLPGPPPVHDSGVVVRIVSRHSGCNTRPALDFSLFSGPGRAGNGPLHSRPACRLSLLWPTTPLDRVGSAGPSRCPSESLLVPPEARPTRMHLPARPRRMLRLAALKQVRGAAELYSRDVAAESSVSAGSWGGRARTPCSVRYRGEEAAARVGVRCIAGRPEPHWRTPARNTRAVRMIQLESDLSLSLFVSLLFSLFSISSPSTTANNTSSPNDPSRI